MDVPASMPRLKGFRDPHEIIAYVVWVYHFFALSARMLKIFWQSGMSLPAAKPAACGSVSSANVLLKALAETVRDRMINGI
jgi:hypothetical protein